MDSQLDEDISQLRQLTTAQLQLKYYELFGHASQTPPRSGWLDGLGRLKGGRWLYLGVARCAPQFTV